MRPALRAEARLAAALVLRAHGERAAARAALEVGLEDARRAPADEVLPLCARLSANLGLLLTDAGEYTAARAYHAEAAAVFRQLGDTRREAASRNNLGLACLRMGDREAAETAFAESLAARRAMDDALGTIPNLANLSELALLRGDIPRATEFAEEAFRIARERRGGDRLIALGAATLGAAREAAGDLPDAVALYREALSLRWNGGHYGAVVELLLRLALIAAQREGQREIAIRLLAGLTALEDRAFGAVEIARRDTAAAALRAEHTDTGNLARFEALWSEGAALGTGEMVALALSEAEGEPARETISVK